MLVTIASNSINQIVLDTETNIMTNFYHTDRNNNLWLNDEYIAHYKNRIQIVHKASMIKYDILYQINSQTLIITDNANHLLIFDNDVIDNLYYKIYTNSNIQYIKENLI